MLQKSATLGVLLVLTACGAGGGARPAQVPQAAEAPSVSPSESGPPAQKSTPWGEAPAGLPSPGPQCAAFSGETPSTCAGGEFDERLAGALSAPAEQRDMLLRCLEKAPDAETGLMRALRADLAPRGCADLVLGAAPTDAATARDVADTLVGLAVGARLYRSVREPPLPRPPFSKPEFLKHFKEVLSPWIAAQAHAVDTLSQVGPRLSGYGRAIVALEAGLADMRFVTLARGIELPEDMQKDPEIRETYFVALEQALEPRVERGRDAALVGLGELSRQGVTNDARLAEARHLLSQLYAGRRIDSLDRLLLPELPALDESSAALKVAARLPAFFALKLTRVPSIDDAKLLRARLEQGVPPALWLDAPPSSSPELSLLRQRALFKLGQTYFWAEAFARAASVEPPPNDASGALMSALSKVLSRGPRNAAALMLGPPTLPVELRDTLALDALAKPKGPMAGLAEFDAAYLRSLAPPANDPAFWKEEAQRYRRAQQKLDDHAAKLIASDLARAASDTEKELRQQAKP